jgi:hypothetical protein
MKVKKYFTPPRNVAMGPHRFMCINPKIVFSQEPPLKGNGVQWCLPYTSITKIQVMISMEIHAFNKVISIHGC